MKKILSISALSFIVAMNYGQVFTFNYTGAFQTHVVPAGITYYQVDAWGAEGGSSRGNTDQVCCNWCTWDPAGHQGGNGGYAEGILAVTPGQTLRIYVGGMGGYGNLGGWNGGGVGQPVDNVCFNGGPGGEWTTSSGGGASDVRTGAFGLGNRVIVAAGGGGAEWAGGGQTAGEGGGVTGGANPGGDNPGASGGPGTQVAGGAGGTQNCNWLGMPSAGGFGFGGNTGTGHSGGGGGGYYGGGAGGCDGHGGGGSSYLGGVTAASTVPGVRQNNGLVTLTNFIPLPVEMMSFTSDCNDDYVTFRWSTSAEVNNSYFMLQRSSDAINWSDVTRVEGNGSSNVQHDYSYKSSTSDKGYYRLVQFDMNGFSKTYDPIYSSCIINKNFVQIYPNPSADYFVINSSKDMTSYEITNGQGQVMVSKTINIAANVKHTVDCSQFAPGVYSIRVHTPDGFDVQKIIIE